MDQCFARAVQLHQSGRFPEAVAILNRLLAEEPNSHEVLHRLGVIAGQTGWPHQSADLLARAIAINPSVPAYHHDLAISLEAAGRIAEAAEKWNDLGNMVQSAGGLAESLGCYDRCLALAPHHYGARVNKGIAFCRLERQAEAAPIFEQLLTEYPDDAEIHNNLGTALVELGREPEAIGHYRKAALARPDMALAHLNLGLSLLRNGQFAEGWREHEWRWRCANFPEPKRSFRQPQWRGEEPGDIGGRLLIITEQGLGDTIQFARYVPLLAARGYDIVFEVQRPIHTLIWQSLARQGIPVLPRTDTPLTIEGDPEFARWIPLLSLPERFGTALDTIPAETPYLTADPNRIARWQAQLPKGKRVGLVWAGRPDHARDRARSIAFDQLRPLLDLTGITVISLQKGPAAAAAATGDGRILALGPHLWDMAETAAVIACLDLVIAVDTSVAHLAGALGKPCWVLLPALPDWRWMLGRADSPWYPSVTLYRQTTDGDWPGVIVRVARALANFAGR
jgi:Tfp pilus assembly protein PilF